VVKYSVDALRTLYFHTGTYKTGSTALQAYLAANKKLLARAGISYELLSGANQSAANGRYLYEHLFLTEKPHRQLEDLLESYFAGRRAAICSSEDFTNFRLQEWQQVMETCSRLQVQVKIVTFIRNIAPYYHSTHGEDIKGGLDYSSFEEYCKHNRYSAVLDSLRCLLDVFGRESMSVIHYESVIHRMDRTFMEALELPPELCDPSPLKQRVNRSLVEYEREVLSLINKALGGQYSRELGNLLLRCRPNLKPARHIGPAIMNILTTRHCDDVRWINRSFFGGTSVLKINESETVSIVDTELQAEDRQAIDRDVTNWLVSKLEAAHEKSIEDVTSRLRAIDWKNAMNPAVPEDFDPVAYLLLNPDLLKVNVPPYEHFILHGRHEKSRRWKWPDR
jgi:hypothetical protein